MSAPHAVVFDMDGLMFNTEDVYHCVGTELMRRRGREYSRELSDAIMGRPAQACFETMIRWHALEPRFAFTLTAEDIVQGKPHPEVYLKAAERFAIEPGQMLVLEDSQTGVRAAAAAGALVVAVPGQHSRNQDFHEATLVIDGLSDPRLYQAISLPRH